MKILSTDSDLAQKFSLYLHVIKLLAIMMLILRQCKVERFIRDLTVKCREKFTPRFILTVKSLIDFQTLNRHFTVFSQGNSPFQSRDAKVAVQSEFLSTNTKIQIIQEPIHLSLRADSQKMRKIKRRRKSRRIICSRKPIDAKFLRRLLVLAKKIWNETNFARSEGEDEVAFFSAKRWDRRNRAALIGSAMPCHNAQVLGLYRDSYPLRLTILAAMSEDYTTAPQHPQTGRC